MCQILQLLDLPLGERKTTHLTKSDVRRAVREVLEGEGENVISAIEFCLTEAIANDAEHGGDLQIDILAVRRESCIVFAVRAGSHQGNDELQRRILAATELKNEGRLLLALAALDASYEERGRGILNLLKHARVILCGDALLLGFGCRRETKVVSAAA